MQLKIWRVYICLVLNVTQEGIQIEISRGFPSRPALFRIYMDVRPHVHLLWAGLVFSCRLGTSWWLLRIVWCWFLCNFSKRRWRRWSYFPLDCNRLHIRRIEVVRMPWILHWRWLPGRWRAGRSPIGRNPWTERIPVLAFPFPVPSPAGQTNADRYPVH